VKSRKQLWARHVARKVRQAMYTEFLWGRLFGTFPLEAEEGNEVVRFL
jgi:hypothetical protein